MAALVRGSVLGGVWFFCCMLFADSGAISSQGDGITAITVPSADVTLSFVQPGRIAQVNVQQGDRVEPGQVLVQQDDAIERAQLAQTEALSKNMSQIQAAEATLEQKRLVLRRVEAAAANNAATELEVEQAKLDVRMAELSLDMAKFDHEQSVRKYEEAQISVENMRLKSPIAGTVEKVEVEVGESVNALADVVRVVRTDPLWVDVPVPLNVARLLRPGQAAVAEFPGPQAIRVQGEITYVAAVADAASGTLVVRVEVPNKGGRPAGEHIKITFSAE